MKSIHVMTRYLIKIPSFAGYVPEIRNTYASIVISHTETGERDLLSDQLVNPLEDSRSVYF